MNEELPPRGLTTLRGVNGALVFAGGGRPDSLGWISESTSSVGKKPDGSGPTWKEVATANSILEWLKETLRHVSALALNSRERSWTNAEEGVPLAKVVGDH